MLINPSQSISLVQVLRTKQTANPDQPDSTHTQIVDQLMSSQAPLMAQSESSQQTADTALKSTAAADTANLPRVVSNPDLAKPTSQAQLNPVNSTTPNPQPPRCSLRR